VVASGCSHVVKESNGKTYTIDKAITNSRVEKRIEIRMDEKSVDFKESVALFSKSELVSMLEEAGFSDINVFGTYALNVFDESLSDRCILVANK
jgi:hypothetical protein